MTLYEREPFYAPERILIVAAHSDDIEFGVAGTVARWTDAGSEVTYCITTDNSAGSNDPVTVREELIELRRSEQMAAAKVVGVEDVRFLGYPDGALTPSLELRRDITRVIRDVRPQIVLTMDPTTILVSEVGYINHPDHRATGEAALYAVFPSAGTYPIFPELLEEGCEPHNVSKLYLFLTENVSLYIDISSTMDRKIEALRCHKSQLGEEQINMVREWDAIAGKLAGVPYAEIFQVMNLQ